MNMQDFQNLSREEQFAQAGRIAGVEPSVFDGLWRTESGRGANQLGPVTRSGDRAEGHFQIMPKTRGTMEKRFGAAIDPYDFGQSLYTAAHLMKENVGKFKNVPDALRAYNGGWDKRTWGNPETAAYADKVLGPGNAPILSPAESEAAIAQPVRRIFTASEAFNTAAGSVRNEPRMPKTATALASLSAMNAPPAPPDMDAGAYRAGNEAAAQRDKAKALEIENTSTLDVLRAAADSSLVVNGLKWATRERYEPVPGYRVKEADLAGHTADEQEDLLDARSPEELNQIKFNIADRAEQSRITNLHGGLAGFGASMLADLPGAVLTGGTATVGVKALGIGSLRLAEQGLKGAALASLTAENVVGNIAATALLDMAGYDQGSADYAMGAAAGLLGPALGGRYVGRVADQAIEQRAAMGVVERAVAQQAKLAERAHANLGADGPYTPADLKAEMQRLDAEGIKQTIAAGQGAIPTDRRLIQEDLLDELGQPIEKTHTAPGPVVAADMEPTAPRTDAVEADVQDIRTKAGGGVAAPFESPAFQAARIEASRNNPEWVASWQEVTGRTYEDLSTNLPKGMSMSPRMEAYANSAPAVRNSMNLAESIINDYLPGAQVMFTDKLGKADRAKGAAGAIRGAGNVFVISLDVAGSASPTTFNKTVMHELGHAIYNSKAPDVSPSTLTQVSADWVAFVKKAAAGDLSARVDRYNMLSNESKAFGPLRMTQYNLSRDEYMAEQFVGHLQNRMLAGDYGNMTKKGIDQVMFGIKAVLGYVLDMVKKGMVKPGKGADQFFREVLEGVQATKRQADAVVPAELRTEGPGQLVASDIPASLTKEVNDFLQDPIAIKYGLDVMPMGTPAERAQAGVMLALHRKADNPAAVWNNVDPARLNKLLAALPDAWGLNPTSNSMLLSSNPVVRMVAVELLENGGGAGGRGSTASMAKYLNERAIMGNSVQDMMMHYKAYRTSVGGSVTGDFMNGKDWRNFNRLVAEETEARRSGAASTAPDSVKAAADTAEAAFERSRAMQVDARTIGFNNLAPNSKGYMPHRMSASVVRNLTLAQRRAVQSAMTDQFVTVSGFDITFADQLAAKYMGVVQRRALGGFEGQFGANNAAAVDSVNEALKMMDLSPSQVASLTKTFAAGGAAHTKKRLQFDLSRQYTNDDGTTFTLMDLFETDQLKLIRSQAQRVSGEAALARHGVMGKPGIDLLRRAMSEFGGDTTKAQPREIEAFDQVAAEFIGMPVGTANKWVDRAMQANSLSSLGGMGFNQLGETINMAMTLGVKSTMANVAAMPRLTREVWALSRGESVDNAWLSSLEHFGGAQFGTDNHKMVFPFDMPDSPYQTMGADSVATLDKLLRGGTHAQGVLSAWRALHAGQQRGAAEQIVMKSLRYIRDGVESKALADMGITPELAASLKSEFSTIVQWKGDRMVGLDITRMANKDAANAYVQAVHRGANQIIQGTFIGESGKFVHSSWGRLMTQFRSFGLTAIDKQWARQRGNYGTATALLMTLGSMSVAAPLYMSRTYLASIGMEDQEAYLEKQLATAQIARATMNYIATSGLAGDFIDAFTAVTGVGAVTGGRSGAQSDFIGNVVAPAAGKADKVWGGVQDVFKEGDVHGLIKELPFARLPWLIPAVNALGR